MNRRKALKLGIGLGVGTGALRIGNPSDASALVVAKRWIDTDFGNNAIPAQSWFNDRKNEGYTGFITTAHTFWGGVPQPWSGTQECLDKALTAGLEIGVYGRPVEEWEAALDNCGSYEQYLKFYQLDVEYEEDGLPHPITTAMVSGVQNRGVIPVIYTAKYMWLDIMGTTTAFRFYRLWERIPYTGWPAYMGNLTPQSPGFGGWKKRWGAQIHYDVAVPSGGPILVDNNVKG